MPFAAAADRRLARRFPIRFATALAALLLAGSFAPAWAQKPAAAVRKTVAPKPVPAATPREQLARFLALEKAVEEQRGALGIPGLALVVVQNDKVVFLKGFGQRDVAKKLPVTPDTLFAIGSSTKAFTAMGVLMGVDAGKIRLDDSPKKYLSYFKMRDPDADARITVRDLLSHRSGLPRTELAWASGKLTRPEVIQVSGMAKPTAKLGEKFQYQNVMYAAAGEVSAQAFGTTWERLMAERIFTPLGMKRTNSSIADTARQPDVAQGYDLNAATKKTRPVPLRDITGAAPAGAINSNATDMAHWLRLLLGRGVYNGRRLVSEASFRELGTKQISVGGSVDYGLGWFLRDWNGHKVWEHGGNIDGFNAEVALMPDKRLGFVLLTNVSNSALGQGILDIVWNHVVGTPPSPRIVDAGPVVPPQTEAGTYFFAPANLTMTVAWDGKKLVVTMPGQPAYPLEKVAGRRYKLGAPARGGIFVTFRPVGGDANKTELFLEQPQANVVLAKAPSSPPRLSPAPAASASAASPAGDALPTTLNELLGNYEREGRGLEITAKGNQALLLLPGQTPLALAEKGKDTFAVGNLPVQLVAQRDAAGKISGLLLKQPNADLFFVRAVPFVSPLTADELLARMVTALGGEAALRKHKTMVARVTLDMENQGVTGEGVSYTQAPGAADVRITLKALGKTIGETRSYFDGMSGGESSSFSRDPVPLRGAALAQAHLTSDFYAPLNARARFESIEIKRVARVGDEDCYVVVLTPWRERGAPATSAPPTPLTDYVSTKTFLIVKRDLFVQTQGINLPVTETYADFRVIDGVRVPFVTTSSSPLSGSTITRVQSVQFDAPVPADAFRPAPLAGSTTAAR